jgi:hypothetical protein
MLTQKQKEEFVSLKVEIIDLNICTSFYADKINRWAYIFNTTTRKYVLEELTAMRYLENGIILHLTNLDDDSSNFSFREVQKQLNKKYSDQVQLKSLNDDLKKYRQNINNLKTQHRNKRIAHLNSTAELNFDEFLNFETQLRPLIIQANEIGDRIWGQRISANFKLGSMEGILDFRRIVETLSIDVNKNQSFS